MTLSREARLVSGVTLLTVPTIMFGGATLVGMLTSGVAGYDPQLELTEVQWSLFRAGHAHAGVWLIFSLVLQVLLDSATLGSGWKWTERIAAPAAAAGIAGGFFGLAFYETFRWLLYAGAACLLAAVMLAGVGLVRRARVKLPHGMTG